MKQYFVGFPKIISHFENKLFTRHHMKQYLVGFPKIQKLFHISKINCLQDIIMKQYLIWFLEHRGVNLF